MSTEIMTPEKKAAELVNKFYLPLMNHNYPNVGQQKVAKRCAIICVEEVLASNNAVKTKEGKYEIVFHSIVGGVEFWEDVLKELNK